MSLWLVPYTRCEIKPHGPFSFLESVIIGGLIFPVSFVMLPSVTLVSVLFFHEAFQPILIVILKVVDPSISLIAGMCEHVYENRKRREVPLEAYWLLTVQVSTLTLQTPLFAKSTTKSQCTLPLGPQEY